MFSKMWKTAICVDVGVFVCFFVRVLGEVKWKIDYFSIQVGFENVVKVK